MSNMRQSYFKDILQDCQDVCRDMGVEPEDQGPVIAALILSDSLNGLRKALMSPNYMLLQAARRGSESQQI